MIRQLRKGFWYWNNYDGLRVITDIDGHGHIRYVVKTAHLELAWDSKAGRVVSIIGRQGKCHPKWFSAWAKVELTPEEGQRLLWEIRAKRTSLSRVEVRFLQEALRDNRGETQPNTTVRTRPEQCAVMRHLVAKGLLAEHGHEMVVTELGAGWSRWHAKRHSK